MPSHPRGKIKIRKINPTPEGVFDAPQQPTDDAWWSAVFNDRKADTPRPQYGREHLGSMAGMLFGIRCEKCLLSKNFYADDLIEMYGATINGQTVTAELSECNRRSQGCFIRYVALPLQKRE